MALNPPPTGVGLQRAGQAPVLPRSVDRLDRRAMRRRLSLLTNHSRFLLLLGTLFPNLGSGARG